MRALLGGLVLGAMTVVGFGAPASAASQLELSADGVHWAAALPGPLFDPTFRWVPGDSETASFWVRNHTGASAVLNLSMLATQAGALGGLNGVAVQARVDNGPWASSAVPGQRAALISNAAMPGKAERRIDVRLSFPYGSANDNATQDQHLGLTFNVSLTQTGGGVTLAPAHGEDAQAGGHGSAGGAASGPQMAAGATGSHHAGQHAGVDTPNSLPETGSNVSPLMILLAALLCAGGAALALFSQRPTDVSKERESSHA